MTQEYQHNEQDLDVAMGNAQARLENDIANGKTSEILAALDRLPTTEASKDIIRQDIVAAQARIDARNPMTTKLLEQGSSMKARESVQAISQLKKDTVLAKSLEKKRAMAPATQAAKPDLKSSLMASVSQSALQPDTALPEALDVALDEPQVAPVVPESIGVTKPDIPVEREMSPIQLGNKAFTPITDQNIEEAPARVFEPINITPADKLKNVLSESIKTLVSSAPKDLKQVQAEIETMAEEAPKRFSSLDKVVNRIYQQDLMDSRTVTEAALTNTAEAVKGLSLGTGEALYTVADMASEAQGASSRAAFAAADLIQGKTGLKDALINATSGNDLSLGNVLEKAGKETIGVSLRPDFTTTKKMYDETLVDPISYANVVSDEVSQEAARERQATVAAVLKKVQSEKGEVDWIDKVAAQAGSIPQAVSDLWDNPIQLQSVLSESSSSMLAPIALTSAKIAALTKTMTPVEKALFMQSKAGREEIAKYAGKVGIHVGATQEAASNANQVYEEILKMNPETLKDNVEYLKLLDSGYSQEEAIKYFAEAARTQAFAVSYAISAGTSKILGTGELEGTAFGLLLGSSGAKLKEGLLDVVKATAKETTQETLESTGGVVAQNTAKLNTVNPEQDMYAGTGDAAAMGAVTGGIMGGGMSTAANAKNIVGGSAGLTKEGIDLLFQSEDKKKSKEKAKLNTEIASKFDPSNKDEFVASTEHSFKDKVEALFSTENLRRNEVVNDGYKATAATAAAVFNQEVTAINEMKTTLNEKITNKTATEEKIKEERKEIKQREKTLEEVRANYADRITLMNKVYKDKDTIKSELKSFVDNNFSNMDEKQVENYAELYRDLGSQAKSFDDKDIEELRAIDPNAAAIVEAVQLNVSFDGKTTNEVSADLLAGKEKTGIKSVHDVFNKVHEGLTTANKGMYTRSLGSLEQLYARAISTRDSVLGYKKVSPKQEALLENLNKEIPIMEAYIRAGKAMGVAFDKGNIEEKQAALPTFNQVTVVDVAEEPVQEAAPEAKVDVISDSASVSTTAPMSSEDKETGNIAYDVIQAMARFTAIDEKYNEEPEANQRAHKSALKEWEAAEQKLAKHLTGLGYSQEQVEDALNDPQAFLKGLVKQTTTPTTKAEEPAVQEEVVEDVVVEEQQQDDTDYEDESDVEEDTIEESEEDRIASEDDIRKEVSDLITAVSDMDEKKYKDDIKPYMEVLNKLGDYLVRTFTGKSLNELRTAVSDYYNGIEDTYYNKLVTAGNSSYYNAGRKFATNNGLVTFSFKALMAYRRAMKKPSLFKYRSKNLSAVLKNPNLLAQIEMEIEQGEEGYVFLKDFTAKEVEALGLSITYLREIMGEIDDFLTISYEGKDGQAQGVNMMRDNPILELTYKNENGEFILDESVKLAIAVGILHMISENDSVVDTLNDDSAINKILGRESDHPVSFYEMTQLQSIGQKLGFMSEIAGETALEVVGLKVSPNVNYPALKDRLQLAMGAIGFRALANLGYMEIVDYSTTKLIEMTQGKGFISQQDAIISQKMSAKEGKKVEVRDSIKTKFVRVTAKGVKELSHLKEQLGSESQLLVTVFGVPDDKVAKMPSREPVTITNKIKRSDTVMPEEQRAKIQAHANQAHTVSAMSTLWNMLPEVVQDKIAGVKTDDELKGLHIYEKLKLKAANQGLVRELKFFRDFVSKGIDGFFYLSHSTSKNSRMDIPEKINVQASKIHRWLLVNAQWKITVDSLFLRQLFKVKVAAAFGASIDTTKNKDLLDEFDSIINNPIVQKAVQAYKNIEAGSTSENDYADLVAGVAQGKQKLHTLAGIKALASYHPTEAFEEDLAMEVDGKTNGFMIGLLQMYGGYNDEQLKDLLQRGGISNDNENLSALQILDSYQTIAKKWGEVNEAFWNNPEIVEDFLEDLKTSLTDKIVQRPQEFKEAVNTILKPFIINGMVTKFARGLAKSPLMVWNYNAGLQSMVLKFVNDVLEQEYKDFAEMKREFYTKGVSQERRAEIESIFAAKSKAYSVLTGSKQEINVKNADTFILEGSAYKNFVGTMGYINGNGISKGIDESFPALAANRKDYNYFLKHMFDVYGDMYDRLAEQYRVTNNVAYVSREAHEAILRVMGKVKIKIPVYLSNTKKNKYGYLDTSTWREFGDYESGAKHRTYGNVVMDTKGVAIDDTRVTVKYNNGLPVVNDNGVSNPKEMSLTPTFISFDVFKNSFTGVAPIITHSIDAHTMTGVFGMPVFNIHDAIVVGGANIKDIVRQLNYSFYEVNFNYSMLEAAKHAAENLQTEIKNFYDRLPRRKFDEDMQLLFKTEDFALQFIDETRKLAGIVTRISKKGNEYSKILKQELYDFTGLTWSIDASKKRIMNTIRYWNQYTMNFSSFQLWNQPAETVQTVEQVLEQVVQEEKRITEAEATNKPYIAGLKMNTDISVASQVDGRKYIIKYTRNKEGALFKHISIDSKLLAITMMNSKGEWVVKNKNIEPMIFASGTMSDFVHADFAKLHDGYSELDGFEVAMERTLLTEEVVNNTDLFIESDSLGSSAAGFGRFTAYRTETIDTVAAVEATIDELQKNDFAPTSDAHYQYLRGLLGQLTTAIQPAVLMLGNAIDGTLGKYESRTQTIKIKLRGIPATLLRGMSAAETFTHEMIHHVVYPYLDKKNKHTDHLRWIWEVSKKHVKVRDFLELDANGNPPSKPTRAQMRAAKDTWNYIFNNLESSQMQITDPLTGMTEVVVKHNGFHEFVAHATTNLQLIRVLQRNIPLNNEIRKGRKASMVPSKATSGTFQVLGDVVTHLFERVMEYIHVITNNIFKMDNPTADVTVREMLKNIINTNQQANLSILSQMQNVEDNLNTKTKEAIKAAVQSKATSFVISKLSAVSGKNIPILSSVAGTVASAGATAQHLSRASKEQVSDYVDSLHSMFRMEEESVIGYTFREAQGVNKRTAFVHKLKAIRSRFIDAMRQNTQSNIMSFINQNLFAGKLTEAENKAMYYMVGKADLQSLNYSVTDLISVLSDDVALTNKIEAIKKELEAKFPDTFNYYIKHADSLGHYMQTGKANEYMPYKNAHTIARLINATSHRHLVKNPAVAEKLINELASLYAIEYSNVDNRDIVANMLTNNPSAVEASMELHKKTLELALVHNFDNNPMLTEKGYVGDVTNPKRSLVFAYQHEVAAYLKDGYKLVYNNPIMKDKYDDNKEEMYVLVNPYGAMNTLQGGALSSTNSRARGTNLIQVRNENGKNQLLNDPLDNYLDGLDDINNYLANIGGEINAQFTAQNTKTTSDNILFPSINDKGDIVNFRYQMLHETKVDALQLRDKFDESMAYLVSHTKDKRNTTVINRIAARAVFDDYTKFAARELHDYVYIGRDSQEKEYRDLWYKIPYDARQEFGALFGVEGLYIRKRNIDNFFGQRELRSKEIFEAISNRFNNQLTRALVTVASKTKYRRYEDGFFELMGMIRDTIVIKFGSTAAVNIFSNWILTSVKTGNFLTAISDTAEGFKYANQYMNTLRNLEQIKLQLDTKKNLTVSEKRGLLSDKLKMEDELHHNPVGYLIKQGVFQTIVEDLDSENEMYSFSSELATNLEKYTNKVPDVVRDLFKFALIQHDTRLYKFMHKTTQLSDFAGRYALYKHNVSKGMSNEANIKDITETFVDYGYATHPIIAFLNKSNFLMFTKYGIRIQKVLATLLIEKPFSLIMLLGSQGLFGNVEDPLDAIMTPEELIQKMSTPWTSAWNSVGETIITAPFTD